MRPTLLQVLVILPLCVLPGVAQEGAAKTILAESTDASVLILTGSGSGRLRSLGTGVLVSANGDILTALHVVKGAAEVQVRLANGDVFDRVELSGTDERRDVAALRIAAHVKTFLTPAERDPVAGDAVYAVTNANGLSWSATSGIVAAVRPSDEVPGAGTGFRLIQFTAPISPGASGGALVDSKAELLGIITSGLGNTAGFAIPAESVLGLTASRNTAQLGSGAQLQTPAQQRQAVPSSSAAVANAKPDELLRNAKTIILHSKTSFLTIDTLQRALLANKLWKEIGLTIVQDPQLADLSVEVDRPLFTYVHTFVLSDKKTTIVLGSGKETAFDGTTASGGIAKDLIKMLAGARLPAQGKS